MKKKRLEISDVTPGNYTLFNNKFLYSALKLNSMRLIEKSLHRVIPLEIS